MIFGAFDIIHPGHLNLLQQAANLGKVTVVVARDTTIGKVKNRPPFYLEQQRVDELKKIKLIDQVILGDSTNPYKVLVDLKPDIILLGYDQKIFTEQLPGELKKINLQPTIIRAKPWLADFFKSSKIRPVLQNHQAGFLLINKPSGFSSHDVVRKVRQIVKSKQVGHAGTLDPLATGLLVVGINEATKLLSWWHQFPKTYLATMEFGKSSDTYDSEGQIKIFPTTKIPRSEIEPALTKFTGIIKQIPPIFSAKKINGQKAYDLARKNKTVQLTPQQVNIKQLYITNYHWPSIKLFIECSTGTYIRSLIHDLGTTLQTNAIMTSLERQSIGDYHSQQSISVNDLKSDFYQANYFIKGKEFLEKINQYWLDNYHNQTS